MRIGLICKPGDGNAAELGRVLGEAGHAVTSCAQEGFGLAAFLKDSFDLVHSLERLEVLMFAPQLDCPLLISLPVELSAEELSACRQAGPCCYFVKPGAPQGLEVIAQSLTEPAELYAELIKRCAREDKRPWGHYEVLSDDMPDHKVKRITVEPGKRLSLQLHHRRAEHWLIVSGQARVTLGEAFHDLGPGQAIDIPVEAAHRIENLGSEPVVFIEVQQGSYFGEDDIVRLQDDFGRN